MNGTSGCVWNELDYTQLKSETFEGDLRKPEVLVSQRGIRHWALVPVSPSQPYPSKRKQR
jgi:hypothetical protein